MDIFGEAKTEEIVAWLRRARSKHSQERIIYERFTVRWGGGAYSFGPCLRHLAIHHTSLSRRSALGGGGINDLGGSTACSHKYWNCCTYFCGIHAALLVLHTLADVGEAVDRPVPQPPLDSPVSESHTAVGATGCEPIPTTRQHAMHAARRQRYNSNFSLLRLPSYCSWRDACDDSGPSDTFCRFCF